MKIRLGFEITYDCPPTHADDPDVERALFADLDLIVPDHHRGPPVPMTASVHVRQLVQPHRRARGRSGFQPTPWSST
jgi:hypothetical protein